MTCGRFYPTVKLVRVLHDAGARVDACDPYKLALALHSNAVDKMHVVPSATKDTPKYIEAIAKIVRERDIDIVMPGLEDGFYLSRYRDAILAEVYAPEFDAIQQLHNKAWFHEVCLSLGLPTVPTQVITSREQMQDSIRNMQTYVARPAYSRGGEISFTNHGPRAGELSVDDISPTATNPYLLQPFVEGQDACSFSIVRDGEVHVHCVYEPAVAASGGYSVQFRSIEDFNTLEAAQRLASEFGYTGFLGLDYRRTEDGFVMIECNPRLSAGIFLTPEQWSGEALLSPKPGAPKLAPAGTSLQYDAYLLIGNVTQLNARQLLQELLTAPDAILSRRDILPGLFCYLNRLHWSHAAGEHHTSLAEELLGDIIWDGKPLPDLPIPSA